MRFWLLLVLIIGSNAANVWLWGVDAPPTISGLPAGVTTGTNTATDALAFTIGDDLTAVGSIAVSAASSNAPLIPSSNCVLSGTGASRTVTITPVNNQFGTAVITITVTDGGGQTASQTIVVTVNDPPTINGLAANVTTNRNTPTSALPFTIADGQTTVTSLTMSAASGNTTLIPAVNCVFGGTGGNRTVTITPANNQTGTTPITVTVTDGGGLTANHTILVVVNAPPTITGLAASVTTNRNTATPALTFIVGDDLTSSGSLAVSATTTNAILIPVANCVVGGSGANRTVTITPANNQTGTATISITVTDDGGLTSNQTIAVTVNALPTITGLAANVTTNRNTATSALAFTIGDDLTAIAALTLSASSNNTTLIPPGNCVFGGSAANRTVIITPANNQTGTATISITVTDDGGLTSKQTIAVTVNAPPTISGLAATVTTNLNTATSALSFNIGDDLTTVGLLTLSTSSSNATLIPPANCVFDASGNSANRTVIITPVTGVSGTATITITVTDGGGLTSNQTIAVTVNALPTITGLAASVATNRNTATAALPFTIGDDLTLATALTLSASSNNTTLIPPGNCVFGGNAANRTVIITPVNSQVGSAIITITVTDGGGQTASQAITVTVNAPPTISGLPGTLNINQYGASLDLPFTVGDDLTPVGSLTTQVTSTNVTVIPILNCVITTIASGSTNRSLKITPVLGLFADSVIIRVTVADGSGQTSFQEITVSVKEINRAPVITPADPTYNYSLNISGYAQILPDAVLVTDPDVAPTLKTGSDYLRITARVSANGVADQDAMVVRNSPECTLNNKRGSTYDILRRGTTTILAEATMADNGSLTITAKDGAETVATVGTTPPGRAAVLGWLLTTINYTNLAGRFATTTNPTRTVEIQVFEGRPSTMPGGQDPGTVTSVITHLLANEPPANVSFKTIVVSPGGSGQLEFTSVGGVVPVFDDQTPNDDLQFTLVRNANTGDLIDLATDTVITSFAGNRLNPAHALYAGGVGYRNGATGVGADGFSLKVADASDLFMTADVAVRITTNVTGEARLVSDPLLTMDRGTSKLYPLNVVGPTSSNVVFTVSALPGFPDPAGAVAVQTGLRTNGEGVLSTAKLTITTPVTGNYLAFLLTCAVGTRVTAQPFIIRLLPIETTGAAN